MILIALLLGALGTADLARVRGASRARAGSRPPAAAPPATSTVVGAALAIVAFVLVSLGLGLAWWWSPIAAAAIIGWLLATREGDPGRAARGSGYWAIALLAGLVLAAFVFGPRLPTPSGPLVAWYDALPYGALAHVDVTTFALAVGGVLFLVETSNVIVRLALRGERSAAPVAPAAPAAVAARRWWQARPAPEPVAPPVVELKGGRFIGPLERLFLLALVLGGQFTAIAALVAAKGIVRFPEISKDAAGGSKAEYFLVGSFASWSLVLLVALLVAFGAPVA